MTSVWWARLVELTCVSYKHNQTMTLQLWSVEPWHSNDLLDLGPIIIDWDFIIMDLHWIHSFHHKYLPFWSLDILPESLEAKPVPMIQKRNMHHLDSGGWTGLGCSTLNCLIFFSLPHPRAQSWAKAWVKHTVKSLGHCAAIRRPFYVIKILQAERHMCV